MPEGFLYTEVIGMKLRFKIPLALKLSMTFTLLFLTIMAFVLYSVQQIVSNQFTEQYYRDVRFAVMSLQRDLSIRREIISSHLRQLAVKMQEDNDFRLYIQVLEEYSQPYIIDYAPEYMATMGLHALQIMDDRGVVLSSGHFRNAFGKDAGRMVSLLRGEGTNPALSWFQRPDRNILCLTSIDSVRIGTRKYFLIGGTEFTVEFISGLKHKSGDHIVLALPGPVIISSDTLFASESMRELLQEYGKNEAVSGEEIGENYTFETFRIPLITESAKQHADLIYLYPTHELIALIANLNKRLIILAGIGVIITVLLSIWRSYSVTGPLQQLAAVAENISLDQPDDTFSIHSRDEVGVLNNALKNMLGRLRKSSLDLAAAEQKAAFADVARKVNHDIKNGFIPIRNVMQHWSEVAQNDPEELASVFNERKETVIDSLAYLENLAREYSRIRPPRGASPIDVNKLVQGLILNYIPENGQKIRINTHPAPNPIFVLGDELQIRRAFDNVLRNAIEAVGLGGTINVSIREEKNQVVVTVQDTGEGIPEEVRQKLFMTSVTTKEDGTGIGLMNVKHICDQYGGKVYLESMEGAGTTVTLTFPIVKKRNNTENSEEN
jgi:signal transduction histidine kinase